MSEALGSWHVTYEPGAWLALCGPTSAVILEPADASWSDLVETLWIEVLGSSSIADLAGRLATYRIDTMPSFAAFFWGTGGMRSLVRGGVRVVDVDADEVVAEGTGVQTWTEVGLGGTSRVRVELPGAHEPAAFSLPMVIGVARVSSVLLDTTPAAAVTSPQGGLEPVMTEEDAPAEAGLDEAAYPATEAFALEDLQAASDEDAYGSGPATEAVDPFVDDSADDDALDDSAADDSALDDSADDGSTSLMELPPALPPDMGPVGATDVHGPTVAAVFCGWGHPNPLGATSCRVCLGEIGVQQPREVAQPVLAVLRTTAGDSVELDRTVLVGRAPSADRSAAASPELLTVSSPSHDISRTHLEITPSEWQVFVTDLHSTNGTILVAPDGSARQLDPGDSVPVELGTEVELAEGVSVLVDYPQ